MYFDTHTHANFAAFADETDAVIKRALEENVWLTNVGTSYETSKNAAELTKKYQEGVYATVGLHPIHTWQSINDPDESASNKQQEFNESEYQNLLNDKVVAVGEIGLDYFRIPAEDEKSKDLQKKAFISQLNFAQKNNLPIVIHCRDAYEDCLEILKAEYKGRGIMHSFTGDWETAKKFLEIGFYVALNGILMFDKSGRLNEVCKNLPSDRILSETDAPYLAPPPYRGKRNEPAYVKYIVEHMAGIRWVAVEEMAKIIFENAIAVYNIKGK
ncbi:MAG: TatD family hydrolase [Candidatus Doudnabacteria bacterium]|nr:TatD family hydrolase [Candidatus Doudnabacteria bacterium]